MADADKKNIDPKDTSSSLGDRAAQERNDKGFSAGMHSLDSTQAPLRTSDGEPDWDAIEGKDKPEGNSSEK